MKEVAGQPSVAEIEANIEHYVKLAFQKLVALSPNKDAEKTYKFMRGKPQTQFPDAPFSFLIPTKTMEDSALYMLLRSLGLQGGLQQKAFYVVDCDAKAIQFILDGTHFKDCYKQLLVQVVKAYKVLMEVFANNSKQVLGGISPSGFTMTTRGNRPDISNAEIFDLLVHDLEFGKDGLQLSLIAERCNDFETSVFVDFTTLFGSAAAEKLCKLENKLDGMVERQIAKRLAQRRKMSAVEVKIPFVESSSISAPKLLKGLFQDSIAQKKDQIIKAFDRLTGIVFEGRAKWVAIQDSDRQLVITLHGLLDYELRCVHESLSASGLNCELVKSKRSFVKIADQRLLLPQLRANLIAHNTTISEVLTFKLKIHHLLEQLQDFVVRSKFSNLHLQLVNVPGIANVVNMPVVSLKGNSAEINLFKDFLLRQDYYSDETEEKVVINFTLPKAESISVPFSAKVLSQKAAQDLNHFLTVTQHFAFFATMDTQTVSARIEYTIDEIQSSAVYLNNKDYRNMRLFMDYLAFRYPLLNIKTQSSSAKKSLSVTVQAKGSEKLLGHPEVARLANDGVGVVPAIYNAMSEVRDRFRGKDVCWDKATDLIERYIGLGLVDAIRSDNAREVRRFFAYKNWSLNKPLPVDGGLKPVFFAEKCQVPDVVEVLKEEAGAYLTTLSEGQADDFLPSLLQTFINGQVNDKAEEQLQTSVAKPKSGEQTKEQHNQRTSIEKTDELLQALNKLTSQCNLSPRWNRSPEENVTYKINLDIARVEVGLLYGLLKQQGMTCNWYQLGEVVIPQESVLQLSLDGPLVTELKRLS